MQDSSSVKFPAQPNPIPFGKGFVQLLSLDNQNFHQNFLACAQQNQKGPESPPPGCTFFMRIPPPGMYLSRHYTVLKKIKFSIGDFI